MITSKTSTRSRESGQAIILIVFVFIGLLAAVGIVVDLGRYLVAQTQLRRAVDAAALAGSAQFRLTASTTVAAVYGNINAAARDTLHALNAITTTLDTDVTVTTCFGDGVTPGTTDTSLCSIPPTKKVKVTINRQLPLIFLSLVGWRSIGVSAESTTEAASVDVALLIDISDSMASDVCGGGDYPCVYNCDTSNDGDNLYTTCHPFKEVKRAALEFLNFLSPGFDRVTVIPFGVYAGYCINPGDAWPDCTASAYDPVDNPTGIYLKLPTEYEGLGKIGSNLDDARAFITSLNIAIPSWAGTPPSNPVPPCPSYSAAQRWDPRQCTNTNIGGSVHAAGLELLKEFRPDFPVTKAGPNHPSKERLRVIVLLTDGAANASGLGGGGAENADYGAPSGGLNIGFCPVSSWEAPGSADPFCRAAYPGFTIASGRHISTSTEYDAVDYTLDWTDYVALKAPIGNDIIAFTIGLGDQVVLNTKGDPVIGEKLLRYIAAAGDDGDLSTNPCAGVPNSTPANPRNCGNYYFAPTGNELVNIFKAIAGRIFTRINQ